MSDSVWPHGLQHARLSCPSPSLGVCSDSCPLNWWCHLTTSSSVVPLSSCLCSFLASGSFPVSQLFSPGGQRIGASASAAVLPMNIQGWFPLGLTGLISLLTMELSRVFSSTTVRKHLFDAHHLSHQGSPCQLLVVCKLLVAACGICSLIREQIQAPCIESTVLATGPPVKFLSHWIYKK